MSRQYLDDITLDIANSYATLTNRDSNWVNHLSISEFVEIRRQAIFEIEKNFSSSNLEKTKPKEDKELLKNDNKQIVETNHTKSIEQTPIKKTQEQTPKEEKNKEIVSKEEKEIKVEEIKENKIEQIVEEDEKTTKEEPKVYDKRHDQEELDLFSRLKD